MLIGGSRISIYLTNMLTASGKDVVVIEKIKEIVTSFMSIALKLR